MADLDKVFLILLIFDDEDEPAGHHSTFHHTKKVPKVACPFFFKCIVKIITLTLTTACLLKALLVYLNEDPVNLIREYMVSILAFGFYCTLSSETCCML